VTPPQGMFLKLRVVFRAPLHPAELILTANAARDRVPPQPERPSQTAA